MISHSSYPFLAPKRVLGKLIQKIPQSIRVEMLHRRQDPAMQTASPFLQNAPISNTVGQRVLERIFEVGEEASFVEELGGLQVGNTLSEIFLRDFSNLLKECKRDIFPDHRSGLQQPLVLRF